MLKGSENLFVLPVCKSPVRAKFSASKVENKQSEGRKRYCVTAKRAASVLSQENLCFKHVLLHLPVHSLLGRGKCFPHGEFTSPRFHLPHKA